MLEFLQHFGVKVIRSGHDGLGWPFGLSVCAEFLCIQAKGVVSASACFFLQYLISALFKSAIPNSTVTKALCQYAMYRCTLATPVRSHVVLLCGDCGEEALLPGRLPSFGRCILVVEAEAERAFKFTM